MPDMIIKSGKGNNPLGKKTITMLLFSISVIVNVLIIISVKDFSLLSMAGSLILVSACCLLLYLFLLHFRKDILEVSRKVLFILAVITFFIFITRLVLENSDINIIYLVPFALIPVLIRTFYDARLALFILLITLILTGFLLLDPFKFIIINILAGIVAILSLSNINRRYKILFSAIVVTITYFVVYLAFEAGAVDKISEINTGCFKWFAGNGILILTGYPVISLFEHRFYFLSDSTLLELSDSGSPLLRRLAEEAPGSYQHSLQVANLAEAAARAIGANVLLARTGSLYHDIGKIKSPGYFIENQNSESSPHIDLDPFESSKVIIKHVEEGVRLASQFKLPVQIIDFIRTHHGTSKAYYFYRKYLESGVNSKSLEDNFQYKGPKPFSKEMAIVMMADAVEAASRTLEKHNEESIDELVERTIIFQEAEDQFSDAPLTFRDISDIKAVFKKRLSNIYHSRIAYPV